MITEKKDLQDLIIFNDFNKEIKKTKEMNNILIKFDAKNSLIILDKNSKEKIEKSIKNTKKLTILEKIEIAEKAKKTPEKQKK